MLVFVHWFVSSSCLRAHAEKIARMPISVAMTTSTRALTTLPVCFSTGAAAVVAAAILAIVGPYWLWPLVFVASMGWSAWRFIDTARRHTDYSMTHAQYIRASEGGK